MLLRHVCGGLHILWSMLKKKKKKKKTQKKQVFACILSSLSCEMVIRILDKMTDVLVSLSIIYMAFTHKTLRKDALSKN